MRGRASAIVAVAMGLLLLLPGAAGANGGAFIEVDHTHVLPGDAATLTAYVYLPRSRQHLLDRGPFFVYLLPGRSSIAEGAPAPGGAVRLGAFTVERDRRESFRLELSFTVPEVAPGIYDLGMCNEPCTLSGLREPLSGSISIVETAREAELLTTQYRLETRNWSLRREVRRAERKLEEATAQLAQAQQDNAMLAALVNDARDGARGTASPDPLAEEAERPLVDGRVVVAAAVLLAIVAGVRRRRG